MIKNKELYDLGFRSVYQGDDLYLYENGDYQAVVNSTKKVSTLQFIGVAGDYELKSAKVEVTDGLSLQHEFYEFKKRMEALNGVS